MSVKVEKAKVPSSGPSSRPPAPVSSTSRAAAARPGAAAGSEGGAAVRRQSAAVRRQRAEAETKRSSLTKRSSTMSSVSWLGSKSAVKHVTKYCRFRMINSSSAALQ